MSSKQLSRFGPIFAIMMIAYLLAGAGVAQASAMPKSHVADQSEAFPELALLLKAQINPLGAPSSINLKGKHWVVYGCDNQPVVLVGGELEIKFGTVKDPNSNLYFTLEKAELVNAIGLGPDQEHFFISGTFQQKLTFNPVYQDQFWSLDVSGYRAINRLDVNNGQSFGATCSYL